MKRIALLTTALSASLFFASCGAGGSKEKQESAPEAKEEQARETPAEKVTWNIDLENSKVEWKGTMVGDYDHFGTVKLTEGALVMEGGNIVGGKFTVDMSSINPMDENYTEEHPKSDLIGHLSSPDFFDVANFPTATFEITGSDMAAGTITGNLTVRGVTNEETVTDVKFDEATGTATGKLVFNRQTYGAAYKAMQDMVLSDDIELSITLKAAGQQS